MYDGESRPFSQAQKRIYNYMPGGKQIQRLNLEIFALKIGRKSILLNSAQNN